MKVKTGKKRKREENGSVPNATKSKKKTVKEEGAEVATKAKKDTGKKDKGKLKKDKVLNKGDGVSSKKVKKLKKKEKKKEKAVDSDKASKKTQKTKKTTKDGKKAEKKGLAKKGDNAAEAAKLIAKHNISVNGKGLDCDEAYVCPAPILAFDEMVDSFPDGIVQSIQATGFEKPTPIQSISWPVLTQEPLRDVISIAKTGSGKTCAFLIPAFRCIHQWRQANRGPVQPSAGPLVLILAPTRELAVQIHLECVKFGGDGSSVGGDGNIDSAGNTGGAYVAPTDVYVPGDSSDEEEQAENNRKAASVTETRATDDGEWAPVSSACVYGGTASQASLLQIEREVLVATPGRLLDLLRMTKDGSWQDTSDAGPLVTFSR
jgi:hypothetical protein